MCLGITSFLFETYLPSSYPAGSGWARFEGLFAYLGNFAHSTIEVGRKPRTEMCLETAVGADGGSCALSLHTQATGPHPAVHRTASSRHVSPRVAGFGILTVHLVSRHVLVSDLGGGWEPAKVQILTAALVV